MKLTYANFSTITEAFLLYVQAGYSSRITLYDGFMTHVTIKKGIAAYTFNVKLIIGNNLTERSFTVTNTDGELGVQMYYDILMSLLKTYSTPYQLLTSLEDISESDWLSQLSQSKYLVEANYTFEIRPHGHAYCIHVALYEDRTRTVRIIITDVLSLDVFDSVFEYDGHGNLPDFVYQTFLEASRYFEQQYLRSLPL